MDSELYCTLEEIGIIVSESGEKNETKYSSIWTHYWTIKLSFG